MLVYSTSNWSLAFPPDDSELVTRFFRVLRCCHAQEQASTEDESGNLKVRVSHCSGPRGSVRRGEYMCDAV